MSEPLEAAKKQRGRPFVKGQSGNPAGRAKKTPELREVEEMARQAAPLAVERLKHWARSNDPGASVRACTALLDRAFGRPAQPIEGEMVITEAIDRPPEETREQWLARKKRELDTMPVQGHADG